MSNRSSGYLWVCSVGIRLYRPGGCLAAKLADFLRRTRLKRCALTAILLSRVTRLLYPGTTADCSGASRLRIRFRETQRPKERWDGINTLTYPEIHLLEICCTDSGSTVAFHGDALVHVVAMYAYPFYMAPSGFKDDRPARRISSVLRRLTAMTELIYQLWPAMQVCVFGDSPRM
jgi:hypothetical protein